jgi:serine/threonine protein kinase
MAAEACVGTPGYLAPELTARRTRPRAGAATAAPAARAGAEHAALDEAAESSEPRPAAAACEAAAAAALCSSAVDIWALGVLAHVLLTARLPFPPGARARHTSRLHHSRAHAARPAPRLAEARDPRARAR